MSDSAACRRVLMRQTGEDERVRLRREDSSFDRFTERWDAVARVGWECATLAMLSLGVLVLGHWLWLVALAMVVRSGFWEIEDKVRAMLGIPLLVLGTAIGWAWIAATQLQESERSSTRLATAGHELGESLRAMPLLSGCLAALYLAYALVRDYRAD
ncbi:MAG: hypothetical protein ACT4PP_10325 [Sporichthyaceae bacterium]